MYYSCHLMLETCPKELIRVQSSGIPGRPAGVASGTTCDLGERSSWAPLGHHLGTRNGQSERGDPPENNTLCYMYLQSKCVCGI